MNDRERFIACLLGEPVDRAPYWLFWGPWRTTWERWEREGKPAHVRDYRAMFQPDQPPLAVPVNCGPCPVIERTVLAEDDETVTFIDSWGIKRRDFKRSESMSEFLQFPVSDRAGWERFKAERLNPDDPARLSGDWRVQCADWMRKGYPIQLGYYPDVGIFGTYRWLLGDEEALVCLHTDPDLVHDIMDHMTSLYLTVFEQVVREVRVDVIHLWEDMCFRNGPLISPKAWEQFMGPCYRRIKLFAQQHNIPLLSVDTDGDPDLITPPMMRAGVNFLFPMEVAAGCDVNAWQSRYPCLGMMGGIDKRALADGPAAIDCELERIRPAIKRGRYIPELDHLIPDDVSWDNYCYYAQALKRMIDQ
ncbi:MAG: hypothetical protein M1546_07045 [Chloroflexi bacterium]|nr:hypothetical protein [Chloroflexota bacterium]